MNIKIEPQDIRRLFEQFMKPYVNSRFFKRNIRTGRTHLDIQLFDKSSYRLSYNPPSKLITIKNSRKSHNNAVNVTNQLKFLDRNINI